MATTTTNSVTLTLGYTGTEFTRKYKFTGVDASALPQVKAKIMEYNSGVPETDQQVFISDDYDASDPDNIIGNFKGIVAAQYQTDVEEDINLNI